ncbi:MAG: DNA methylase N-4/N-6 domain-containing protein [Candidatus Zambryskibacteria bacterium RIFCSPLOWO2_12_39_8]|uniref:DNA methylase N-4/N-6 domain-containing protein n=1 Tax=Candidatus Zambryskibacteria bacterium RIFCSPLOWO2_12_39_8 TaxID=1802774 RepID=A0A1G2UV02_9BACT|nr:MAG: DNA methylase N-4/N-6 domain-containing protein [Candidatus Zambryskibacteria bacterium RIFCSPLOWO2_12_39_8]
MKNILEQLTDLLKKDERLASQDGILLKNQAQELARKNDPALIRLLLSDKAIKQHFFFEVEKTLIFDKEKFIRFVSNKQFLPDSYTAFKNKIGLTAGDEYLSENKEVVLVWPYKDCVLEGGMTKEDQKRDEIFYNETLAPDDINRLLDAKVFTNFKRIDKKGEHKLDGFNRDEKGTIKDNLIIKGNNLLALASLKKEFAGKVKLIYIDPPFNTDNTFAYNDSFDHSTWLVFMRNRLEMAKQLLTNDGSIYVNIDYNEVHYLKILMDEVFGRNNFQREIIWRIGWLSGYKTIAKNYIRNHDTILFYTKDPNDFVFNKAYNTKKDFTERFNADNKKEILEKLEQLKLNKKEREDFLTYVSEVGLPDKYPLEDTWNSSVYDKLNSIAVVSYSGEKVSKMLGVDEIKGQKSEKLLQRIIEVSTNEGDIVLDYHIGTGTTCAVAHKINRQYIGIEQMEYIENTAIARLKEVIKGEGVGISKDVDWKGGGDFVYMELAKWNEEWIEKIEKAKTGKELAKLWDEMKKTAFLSYKVEPKTIDTNVKDFANLSIADQKKFLIECLDKNQLYVNLSEIEDKEYGVSKEDMKLNKEFYK